MILDAKRLASRLKDKEMMADEIINESEKVNYQLDSMRQFVDDLNALNALARERSNTEIIHQIHAENPQIREIQAENRQLKASIEEHQRAIELIMTKYRQHTQAQIEDTKLDFEKLLKVNNSNCSHIISQQAEKYQEAIGVMQDAIRITDGDSNDYLEQLTQLKTENNGLRELLCISKSMNSVLVDREKKEISTQTDE